MNEEKNDDEEIEIDLGEVWAVIRQKIWVILAMGLIGAAIVFCFSKYLITPIYSSTAHMLVLTKETTLSSLADLQMGTQLTKDYSELIQSPPVLEETITDLKLDLTYKELKERITIENPEDTRILEITVEDADPEMAQKIVNKLSEVSASYISEVMEVSPPTIFAQGEVAEEQTSPNVTKNTVIGGIVGILLAIVIVVISAVTNDAIQTEDDVEKYLNLSVLASIPDREAKVSQKSSRKSKKKKKKKNNGGRRS